MKELKNVATRIAMLPRSFNQSGTKSMKTLLSETGYSEVKELLSVSEIKESLRTNPECVSEWLQYSEDKRVESGWYFRQTSGGCTVGKRARNGRHVSEQSFPDALDACAVFIKQEVESIAT